MGILLNYLGFTISEPKGTRWHLDKLSAVSAPHVAAEVSTAIRATASTALGWGLYFPAPDLHMRNGHFCPSAEGEEEEQATKLEIIPN